jgi:gas vesicle protein GvpN
LTEHFIQSTLPETDRPSSSLLPDHNPWIGLSRDRPFFENEEIRDLLNRAFFYVLAGIPVHFRGAAGLGKTALALRIAERVGRPVAFMSGNNWMTTENFIGKEVGQSATTVVDKYIQSVRRTETRVRSDWNDAVLATAMEQGHTLIYDEFTRSSAKANGALLSVLEEGVLVSSDPSNARAVLEAHPDFRVILTSNPTDYAGVNAAPDALLDRMVTFNLAGLSASTECGIVASRSGLDIGTCTRIVEMVRLLRDPAKAGCTLSMRTSILIARIAALKVKSGGLTDASLARIAADVLAGRSPDRTASQIENQIRIVQDR